MIRDHDARVLSYRPSSRFLRSVRLDRDLADQAVSAAYTITPQVRAILRRVAAAIGTNGTDRAWTVTGPYGTGKSAWGLFLAQLVGTPGVTREKAWTALRDQVPLLAQELEETLGSGGRMLPVVATLRRAPVSTGLNEALAIAAERLPSCPQRDALVADLRRDLESRELDTKRFIDRVRRLNELANATGTYRGLLIILDELGKALEYAARHEGDDIYVLQELAEAAQRSAERPILVVGILHQSFDNYTTGLDTLTRNEWGKVQGRFTDVAFLEPAEQMVRLIGQVLRRRSDDLGVDGADRYSAEAIAAALVEHALAPRQMSPAEFCTIAASAEPLHPMTLVSLPYLFRRLAQNERSMFIYLSGSEPFGLQDIIGRNSERFVRLPDLYDYCIANVGGLLVGQVVSRHWIEISDAITRAPDLSEAQVQVLKTVGLLGILGEFSHLRATQEAVCLALDDTPFSEQIRATLEYLRSRSFLAFRRYDGSYRIWEGSDIDIDERLQEARRRTVQQLDLAATLHRHLPQRPIVARRHSFESGATRYLEVQYFRSTIQPAQIKPTGQADGVIALCLPDHPSQVDTFRQWAADQSVDWPADVIVVLPGQLRGLREAAADLQALNWVWDNTPELRDDRVARRELGERMMHAEQSLIHLIDLLLDPRPEPLGSLASWFHRGRFLEVKSLGAARQFLSTVMDDVYYASPRIRNELINRRTLSSSAAAARRTLIERMLQDPSCQLLGMQGYPPERSIYESVLQDSGLHREDDSVWTFGPPPSADPRRLLPAWTELRRMVFSPSPEPVPLDRLFSQLSAPPFGVMPGVVPILFAVFIRVYSDETSLYREGRFVPEPAIADFEVLMRRPELFAVAGSRVQGERAVVVQRIARGLKSDPAIVPVVRAMVRGVRSLPETSWRTRRLSPDVSAVRQAFEQAGSPERLLFSELPAAVGEDPFADEGPVDPERIERFFERLNTALGEWSQHAPNQVAWARDALLAACDVPTGPSGWSELTERARGLLDQPIDSSLVLFVKRLAATEDDRTAVESVLALVAGKPPKSWLDPDVDQYQARAREFGERFRYAYEALAPLTPEERRASDELASHLKAELGEALPRRVVRSALAALLAELSAHGGGD